MRAQSADVQTGNPGAGESTGETVRADKPTRRRYRREYVRWLWPYRLALAVVFILALVTAGLDLAWPAAMKLLVDLLDTQATYQHKIYLLNLYGALTVALLVGKQALDSIRGYRLAILNSKVVFRLRHKLFHRLLHLPLGELAIMKTGGIVSRLSGDVESVSGLVQMALISPGVAGMRVLLTVSLLIWLNWHLAVAALIALPPIALVSYTWTRRVRPLYRSIYAERAAIDARVNETFGGIRVVRSFRREPHEERSYAVGHHTIIRKMLHINRVELTLEAAWGILIPVTLLTIVWYGGLLYLRHQIKIGDIFIFNVYIVQLLQPVWAIVSSISQTQKSMAAMERVFQTLEMATDKPDIAGAVDAPRRVREVRFDNVCFGYRQDKQIIHDFSLTVPGGSVVALVGPSGAGKTTLTDLIARFNDPTTGRILLDGIDLRNLRLHSYRSLLAVVPQEVFLFDGTIRQNIAYGRRAATHAEIESAARRANAHEFIEQLPQGYDTPIGERGFKLSGGQRQRLSIARAILADPLILILDEATSNLDTESEQLIQAALTDLFRDRTTFVIAHRLSTVTHADIIVALESGRIREVGTHDELIERQGFYYEMVNRQREAFEPLAMSA